MFFVKSSGAILDKFSKLLHRPLLKGRKFGVDGISVLNLDVIEDNKNVISRFEEATIFQN